MKPAIKTVIKKQTTNKTNLELENNTLRTKLEVRDSELKKMQSEISSLLLEIRSLKIQNSKLRISHIKGY